MKFIWVFNLNFKINISTIKSNHRMDLGDYFNHLVTLSFTNFGDWMNEWMVNMQKCKYARVPLNYVCLCLCLCLCMAWVEMKFSVSNCRCHFTISPFMPKRKVSPAWIYAPNPHLIFQNCPILAFTRCYIFFLQNNSNNSNDNVWHVLEKLCIHFCIFAFSFQGYKMKGAGMQNIHAAKRNIKWSWLCLRVNKTTVKRGCISCMARIALNTHTPPPSSRLNLHLRENL